MAAVMLFLQQTTGKTERHTHFCMPLEPVFTRDCGGRVHFTDEPTGALNRSAAAEVMSELVKLNRESTAVLVVTHDSRVAAECGRILYLLDGRINGELTLNRTADAKRREDKVNQWLREMGW